MTTKNPLAFVLVPGSFSPASFWDPVTPFLTSQGHESYPIELKSTSPFLVKPTSGPGSDAVPRTLYDDAASIVETAERLMSEGKDVVVGLNSYAGFPGSESVKGLLEAAAGKKGRFLGLVYVASFLPKAGQSSNTLMQSFQEGAGGGAVSPKPDTKTEEVDGESKVSEAEYMDLPNHDTLHEVIFNELPADQGKALIKQMRYQSTVSFTNELTYEGYKHAPAVSFILPEDDLIIPPHQQRRMVDEANAAGAKVKVVDFHKSGHAPMISFPEKVAGVLVDTAAEGAAAL